MKYEKIYNKLIKNTSSIISKAINKDGLTEKEFLDAYAPGDYERPSVTVDMLIFTIQENELKLLLIKRKDHPYINHWAIPGGFVNMEESTLEAAERELKEETNIDNVYMEQLYTWSNPNRDPRMRVISNSYIALVNNDNLNPIAGDDAAEVAWFSVKKKVTDIDEDGTIYSDLILRNEELDIEIDTRVFSIPKQNGVINTFDTKIVQISDIKLAFDHIDIVNMAIDRLRNKVEYTPIAFNLVSEKFTLPDLQKVYEILLDKPLYKANFRNKIAPMVVELDDFADTKHRPAKLYTYNKYWNILN